MTAAEETDEKTVRRAVSRFERAVTITFLLPLAGLIAFIHSLFEPIMPSARLWSWSGSMAVVVSVMAILLIAVTLRQPSDDENARIWVPLGIGVTVLFDVAIGASVWILLPYASEPLLLGMVIFYTAAIGAQVIATAEALAMIGFGIVSILGSAALFFLVTPGPYSTPIALFLVALGATLMGLAVALRWAVRSAIAAHAKAEAVSRELAVALGRVTTAQAEKNRFIAAATHDLRQPLQAAALFFDQSIKGRDALAREQAAEGARLAFKESNTLLDQILDHMRLDVGRIAPRLVPISAGTLIDHVAAECTPIALVEGIRIKTVATSLCVLADSDFTARVMRNFVQNALRHAQCERVLLGARRHGSSARLYVLDDGTGIRDEDRAVLFEEYAQGSAARGRARGMGLGLASARRLAELMDGRADLDTGWRHGAAFFLELPMVSDPPN